MNTDFIETGDILFYKGVKPISKIIIPFMQFFGLQHRLPTSMIEWTPSHAGTFIRIDGVLYLYESIKNSFKPTNYLKEYKPDTDSYIINTPIIPYSLDEKKEIVVFAQHLVEKTWIYGYFQLIWWAVRVLSFGKINIYKDGIASMVCYESTCRIAKHLRSVDWSINPEVVDIYRLQYNNKWKTKYSHK